MSNSREVVPAVLQEIASQVPSEYAVLEFLGEGAHGIVLKARQKTLQQLVALKIIKTDGSADMAKQIARMQTEAKVLARLSHQNIVKVYQMGACSDGTPFLVCEYIEGVTLSQLLGSEEVLSPRKIVEVFTQILDALDCAHSNNLLHRDLKPGNVMIMKDPESDSLLVKLLDFGIARELEGEEGKLNLTRTIQLSGSAPYMSPEQCRGDKLDARADLYSVACMLYECLSGKPPFQGETPMHTRYLQLHQAATLPASGKFENTVSRAAAFDLCLKALSKDADARPSCAREFKSMLLQALPNAGKRNRWTERQERQSSFGKHIALIICAIMVCLVAASMVYMEKKGASELGRTASTNVPKIQSARRQLSQLLSESERFEYSNSADNTMKALEIRKGILTALQQISPKEKGIQFVSYRSVADIERHLQLRDSEDTWKKALSFCRLPDGEYTVEASDCYENLASLYLNSNRYDDADAIIKIGLEHARKQQKDTKILDVPSAFEVRTGIHYLELLRDRGNLESRRKEHDKAIADYQFVEEAKFQADELRQAVDFEGVLVDEWIANGQEDKVEPFFRSRLKGFDAARSADFQEKADAFGKIRELLIRYPELHKIADERYEYYLQKVRSLKVH